MAPLNPAERVGVHTAHKERVGGGEVYDREIITPTCKDCVQRFLLDSKHAVVEMQHKCLQRGIVMELNWCHKV